MSRYYPTPNGDYPSVTTVTGIIDKSDALVPWGINCFADLLIKESSLDDSWSSEYIKEFTEQNKYAYKTVKGEAADLGTGFHDLMERFLKNERVAPSKEYEKPFYALTNLLAEERITVIHSEQKVYHNELRYAGTCDMLCWWNGKKYVLDIKTTPKVYKVMALQLAAYAKCFDGVEGIGIIHVEKKKDENGESYLTGKVTIKDFSDILEEAFEGFKCCLYLFNLLFAKKSVRDAA